MNAITPRTAPTADPVDQGIRFAAPAALTQVTRKLTHHMKTSPGLSRRAAVLAALLVPCAWIQAQTTAAPTPASAAADEEVITLTPFEVKSTSDSNAYTADSTLSGNRLRTDLRDIGSS